MRIRKTFGAAACAAALVATMAIAPSTVAASGVTAPLDDPPAAEAAPLARSAGFTPVVQSVHSQPRWFRGDDGSIHIDYEVLVTNPNAMPVDLTAIEVLGPGGERVERLSGSRLEDAMTLLGVPTPATTELPPASVGVVWMNLTVAGKRQIPSRLSHRLTTDVGPGLPVGPKITQTGARAKVAARGATVIAPPLLGPRWAAVTSVHRRSMVSVGGHLRLGQRYAVDFSARLDRRDRTHSGSSSRNSSYFNYGEPVVAVGSGRVVESVDRYPDQIPNDAVPVPLDAADGNHVIIKLDKHVYAGYAHLKPGTVRVERGQRVRAGQVLGKLGNSGNTSGPHLHFQLMNRPSLLDSEGLPFVIDRFELDGRMPSLEEFIDADRDGTPVPVDRSVAGSFLRHGLTSLDVVSFAGR
jgi:murein DD-endopeptidase MepM/ murein hydrolase activator NlpD